MQIFIKKLTETIVLDVNESDEISTVIEKIKELEGPAPVVQTDTDDECYAMGRNFKGILMIINSLAQEQPATQNHVVNLTELFVDLGFEDVLWLQNPKAEALQKALVDVENNNFADYNTIFVVLIGHGDCAGKLWTAWDSIFYQRDWEAALSKNQSLVSKPKLLIREACRGSSLEITTFKGQGTSQTPHLASIL